MKKLAVFSLAALFAAAAFAGMNQRTFAVQVDGTNAVARTATIRGDIGTIWVEVPDGATGTVAVATSTGETLVSKSSISADATWHPVVQSCGNNGTAISNEYQRAAVSGPVTVTVTGTGTNTVTWKVGVVYDN